MRRSRVARALLALLLVADGVSTLSSDSQEAPSIPKDADLLAAADVSLLNRTSEQLVSVVFSGPAKRAPTALFITSAMLGIFSFMKDTIKFFTKNSKEGSSLLLHFGIDPPFTLPYFKDESPFAPHPGPGGKMPEA
jgi:hypothetical protein